MMKSKIEIGGSQVIHLEINTQPIPGDCHKGFIYIGRTELKKVGGLFFNYAPGNDGEKYCIFHHIHINENYQRLGIAYKVFTQFLKGFDECVTEVDSKAGLNLILKCGFKTDDQINYLWNNEKIKGVDKK